MENYKCSARTIWSTLRHFSTFFHIENIFLKSEFIKNGIYLCKFFKFREHFVEYVKKV